MTAPIPTPEELSDFAHKTRPDIGRDQMRGAILAAQTAGWEWPRILIAVAIILAKGEEPRDLIAATVDPLKRHRTA